MDEGLTRASGVNATAKCSIEALNFFSDPYVDRVVDGTFTTRHSTVAAITPNSTSFEFLVPGDSHYLSPRHTLIEIKFRLLNWDGSKLKPDTDVRNAVGCIQSPAFSMFKSIEVYEGPCPVE